MFWYSMQSYELPQAKQVHECCWSVPNEQDFMLVTKQLLCSQNKIAAEAQR